MSTERTIYSEELGGWKLYTDCFEEGYVFLRPPYREGDAVESVVIRVPQEIWDKMVEATLKDKELWGA